MAAEEPRAERPIARSPARSPSRVFGTNLRRERLRQCKSTRGLAEIAGMHGSEISRLERGLRDPRLSTMLRVATALEVPLVKLLAIPTASAESTEIPSTR